MANRTRTHRNEVYLDDEEQFILEAKFKESKIKSKSAFLRKLILFGFVYDVDYSYLRNYNTELADKVLEGKYSYVVTTHIDKGHVHNHIIFFAADNINHDKYHDCDKTYYRIRHLSDELCKEHNLSIISPTGQRGKKYNE